MKSTPGIESDSATLLASASGVVCALAHEANLGAVRNGQSLRDISAMSTCCSRIATRYARTVVFGIGSSSMRNQHA